jgi:DNA-binding transcriptional LysR family regulator
MFRKLVYLLALASEEYFGRAAEKKCHVSQPTLSNAIRQLEEELRIPIVEHGQKFAGFTPEGGKVLDSAHSHRGTRAEVCRFHP